jgi:hypothetical protein
MSANGTVRCPDVEVVRNTGLVLICRIGGREVMVPPLHILPGTTIRRVGDRGTLVVPDWVAHELGVAGKCSSAG